MKQQNLSYPKNQHAALMCGPKIKAKGPFWDAYHCMLNDDSCSAAIVLMGEYLEEEGHNASSERLDLIFKLSHDDPINLDALDWPQMLAATNDQASLLQHYRAERILPVHAISAMIDFGHHIESYHLFPMSGPELKALLEVYDLEMDVIATSPQCDQATRKWLVDRQKRAEVYFQKVKEHNATS